MCVHSREDVSAEGRGTCRRIELRSEGDAISARVNAPADRVLAITGTRVTADMVADCPRR